MSHILTKDISDVPASFHSLFEGSFDASKAINVIATFGNSITNYSHQILAGRLLIYSTTRSCQDVDSYIEAYKDRLNKPTALFMQQHSSTLNKVMKDNEHLDYEQHDYFSANCLVKQYLLKTFYNEEPLESIQMMHMRQAVQFYAKRGIDKVLKCYDELSNQFYTHATPTVCNAGTTKNQESSCFLIHVGDDMDDISETVHTISSISKLNGGVGIGASEFRHSEIGHVGVSEGPNGFLAMYDKTISKVRQGNTRNGAGTAFLPDWHYDFAEFVKMTDNFRKDRFEDLNTCGWMSDLFYVRVRNSVAVSKMKEKSTNSSSELTEEMKKLKTHWTMFCPKKAEILKENTGIIDFIRKYNDLETLAAEREQECKFAESEVKRIHLLLTSNPTNENRKLYLKARKEKERTSKARIDHMTMDAYELYRSIISVQGNSGMPYMMNGDACQKSNQKNLGKITQSNLCLEVLEVTKPHTADSPAEIASCNLASMNIPRYVKGKVDWRKHNKYTTPEESATDLTSAFDFTLYGQKVRSVVENLNEVIDHNYYPLDERDKNGNVTKQGPISSTNLKNRPLGIGVSGQSDALSLMDCTYLGKPATMFNKMLYATKYFNAHLMGMALAVRDGEYENFRTGSYQSYIGVGNSINVKNIENSNIVDKVLQADENGFITRTGSPLANGQFQFDLWQEEAKMLKDHNLLNENIYDVKDDIPVEPTVWGQQILYVYVVPLLKRFKTEDNQNIEITPIRRQLKNGEIEIIIEPTWDSLRKAIMKYGSRNSLYIAIMPTATSANSLRNCEATEAHQSMIYSRGVKAGSFIILNRHLYFNLKELNLWSSGLAEFIAACDGTVQHIRQYILDHVSEFPNAKFELLENRKLGFSKNIDDRLNHIIEMFKTMYDISQKEVLKQVRQRGIYICQSQSTNIYIKDPTNVQMEALHLYANALRLKTGMYYLRQSPAKSAGKFSLPAHLLEYAKNLGIVKEEMTSSSMTNSPPPSSSPLALTAQLKAQMECSLENKEACILCQV